MAKKEEDKIEMVKNIINYVLVEPDDPPEPEKLLKWIRSMGWDMIPGRWE
jgi:hypothetical protein